MSKLIPVLVLAGLLISCSTHMRELPQDRFLGFVEPADRFHDYRRFAFHDAGNSGSMLVEGLMERQLRALLENKGYVYDPLAPEFTVGLSAAVERDYLLRNVQGITREGAVTAAWGEHTLDGDVPHDVFLHRLTLKARDNATLLSLWTHETTILSESRDVRITSNDMLKNIVSLLPSHGTSVRSSGTVSGEAFDRFAFRNVLNRDFTLPDLKTYITLTPARSAKEFNPDELRSIMDDPRLLPAYIDLLETAVYYKQPSRDELEIAGAYVVDGETLQLYVRARKNGLKYQVTEMRQIGGTELAALQTEMLTASQDREGGLMFDKLDVPDWMEVIPDSVRQLSLTSTVWHSPNEVLPDSVQWPPGTARETPWHPPQPKKPAQPKVEQSPSEPYSMTPWFPLPDTAAVNILRRQTPWYPEPGAAADDDREPGSTESSTGSGGETLPWNQPASSDTTSGQTPWDQPGN